MNESDIRPADLFQKYLELSAADALTYFTSSKREDIPCPACDSEVIQPAFEKWGFPYVFCETCGSLFQSPRPPQEEFSRFYQESPSARYWAQTFFPAVAEARRKNLFRPKVEEIHQLCRRDEFSPHILADVGAGYGLLLEEWQKRFPQTDLIAIEPNPDLAEICRSKKFKVAECFCEEAADLYGRVDLVIALEVIEHVYDPLSFLKAARNLMRDAGRVLITGLSVDGFDIQVLWEHSKSISPPHHINFISIKGFEYLLKRAGLLISTIFTPGKLDVDIVKNTVANQPEIISSQRFLGHLLGQEEQVLAAFQNFLQGNCLSSHCWIWATK